MWKRAQKDDRQNSFPGIEEVWGKANQEIPLFYAQNPRDPARQREEVPPGRAPLKTKIQEHLEKSWTRTEGLNVSLSYELLIH